jgi:hypothetical protein
MERGLTTEQIDAVKAKLEDMGAMDLEELKENLKHFDSFPTKTFSTSGRPWAIIRRLERVYSGVAKVKHLCVDFAETYLTEYQAPAFRVLEKFGVEPTNHVKPFNEAEALAAFKQLDKGPDDNLTLGAMHEVFRMCFNACVMFTPKDVSALKGEMMTFAKVYEVMSHIYSSLKLVVENGKFEGSEKMEAFQLEIYDILDGHPNRNKRARNEAEGNKYRPSLGLATMHIRMADFLRQERPGDLYKHAAAFVCGYGVKLAELYKLVSSNFSHLLLSRVAHERWLPCEHIMCKYGLRPFTNYYHFIGRSRLSIARVPFRSALPVRLSLRAFQYLSRCGRATGGPLSFLTLIKALRPLWTTGARTDTRRANEVWDALREDAPSEEQVTEVECEVEPLATMGLRKWTRYRGRWVQYYECRACTIQAKDEPALPDHVPFPAPLYITYEK